MRNRTNHRRLIFKVFFKRIRRFPIVIECSSCRQTYYYSFYCIVINFCSLFYFPETANDSYFTPAYKVGSTIIIPKVSTSTLTLLASGTHSAIVQWKHNGARNVCVAQLLSELRHNHFIIFQIEWSEICWVSNVWRCVCLFVFTNLVNPLDIIFWVMKFMAFVCASRTVPRKTKQNIFKWISRFPLNKNINHDRADKLIKPEHSEIFMWNAFVCLIKRETKNSSWCCELEFRHKTRFFFYSIASTELQVFFSETKMVIFSISIISLLCIWPLLVAELNGDAYVATMIASIVYRSSSRIDNDAERKKHERITKANTQNARLIPFCSDVTPSNRASTENLWILFT